MSNATAAGIPFTIDDVEYTFSPLDLGDLEFLELWLKSLAINAGHMAMPEGLSKEQRAEFMEPILDRADKINLFDSENGLAKLMTAAGIMRMLHRMVQHKHPEVKIETVRKWVETKGLIDELMTTTMQLFPKPAGGAKRGTKKKPSRRNRSTAH